MEFIILIIFGALVGWIASLIMKTDLEQGAVINVVVGVIGSVIGGWFMNFFGKSGVTGLNLYSLAVAVFGAVILITIVKALRR